MNRRELLRGAVVSPFVGFAAAAEIEAAVPITAGTAVPPTTPTEIAEVRETVSPSQRSEDCNRPYAASHIAMSYPAAILEVIPYLQLFSILESFRRVTGAEPKRLLFGWAAFNHYARWYNLQNSGFRKVADHIREAHGLAMRLQHLQLQETMQTEPWEGPAATEGMFTVIGDLPAAAPAATGLEAMIGKPVTVALGSMRVADGFVIRVSRDFKEGDSVLVETADGQRVWYLSQFVVPAG